MSKNKEQQPTLEKKLEKSRNSKSTLLKSTNCANPSSQPSKKPKTKKTNKLNDFKNDAGVTENAPYSHLAKYRMITTDNDVANSSSS